MNRSLHWVAVTAAMIALGGGVGLQSVKADDGPLDFRNDVMPVLTKLGCNVGSCHGSAFGRGGFKFFKLSLYGGRPEADFLAITRESKGRRVNLFDVKKSLLLRKPGGDIVHGGQQRFEVDDQYGRLLVRWIQQGALLDAPNARVGNELLDLELSDPIVRCDQVETSHPFKFFARFSDGSRRDVTAWTVLTSDDESSVSVDSESNVATVHRRGRHVLVARYLNRVKPIEMIVPFGEPDSKIQWDDGQSAIDDYIYEKLNQLGLPATSAVGDAGIIRRLALDLTGRLPSPQAVQSFVRDRNSDKRSHLIAKLLTSESFNDYWTCRFSNLLRIRSQPQDSIGAKTYFDWLKRRISDNVSWNKIARELLLAGGDSHSVGPANFYRTTKDARLQAEFVSESLMGITLRCANCHNHPLDSWTQDDYHGLAAIFARTKQGRYVVANPTGENVHPLTGRPASLRVPGQDTVLELRSGDGKPLDHRKPFADWLLASENPFFARAMVNRIWQGLMGRGLVVSLNDLRATSPASHPELLQWLADDFVANDFDIRHTIFQICMSDAYQRDRRRIKSRPETNASNDEVFYGFSPPRQLAPEVLADAICDVTGVAESFANVPSGTRAVELFDSRIPSRTLDVLGRCSREESCDDSGGQSGGGLSTQLHLMNGALINKKIGLKLGRLGELISQNKSSGEILQRFYMLAFSRTPTTEETSYWLQGIESGDPGETVRRERLEDFVWSLLNSQEFLTNH